MSDERITYGLEMLRKFFEICDMWADLTQDERRNLRHLTNYEPAQPLTDPQKEFCGEVYGFSEQGSALEHEINKIWNPENEESIEEETA